MDRQQTYMYFDNGLVGTEERLCSDANIGTFPYVPIGINIGTIPYDATGTNIGKNTYDATGATKGLYMFCALRNRRQRAPLFLRAQKHNRNIM